MVEQSLLRHDNQPNRVRQVIDGPQPLQVIGTSNLLPQLGASFSHSSIGLLPLLNLGNSGWRQFESSGDLLALNSFLPHLENLPVALLYR